MTLLKELAQKIVSSREKSVAALLGAGISVGSGIPDFRSKGGMYDTLRPELLTATPEQRQKMQDDPTSVVSWEIFKCNQFPYLELRKPFIMGINTGKWKPTLSHWFLKELENRGLLRRVYSQNIDGLDYQTGLNSIVSCHGSLGEVSCEFCGEMVDKEWFIAELKSKIKDIYGIETGAPEESSPIACPICAKTGVKPSTVLYGRALPQEFFMHMENDFPSNIDLLFVIGTSLTVGPANMVAAMTASSATRVIFNTEHVGIPLGLRYDIEGSKTAPSVSKSGSDYFLRGNCDEMTHALLKELAWIDSLASKRDEMAEKSAILLNS